MTATAFSAPARARDVLASEWIKLRSVRSTYLVLLFALAAAVGIGYLVARADATHWATMTAAARSAFDPVYDSFTGLGLAQLAFGALGVLVISSEYTTGLIRTTFAAAPGRRGHRRAGRRAGRHRPGRRRDRRPGPRARHLSP